MAAMNMYNSSVCRQGYLSGQPQNTKANRKVSISLASDTTVEPSNDSSETSSVTGSSDDGIGFNCLQQMAPLPPKREPLVVTKHPKKKPPSQQGPSSHRLDFGCKEACKGVSLKNPVSLQGVATKAPSNSSPDDFATAWKIAAIVGAWKGDENQGNVREAAAAKPRKVAQHQECKQAPPVKISVHEAIFASGPSPSEELQDIPLPKWIVSPMAGTSVAKPASAAATPLPNTLYPNKPPPGLGPPGPPGVLLSAPPGVLLANPVKNVAEDERTPASLQDMPLKVYMPSMAGPEPCKLDPALPCKKRVPDWGF